MFKRLREIFSGEPAAVSTAASATPDTRDPVTPVHRRVLVVVHNPPTADGRRLTDIFGWNDPDKLVKGYINDLRECSGGYLNYQVVERISADWFPVKEDGFRYTAESYLAAWQNRRFHEPDRIDYRAQVAAFDLLGRYNRREIDEAWFVSFPYSGDYESTMIGPGAFWCNSPPVAGTSQCAGRFVLMAFNYERGVDCMLENFGHRVESIMSRVYEHRSRNMWELFTRYDKIAPNNAHCGNVHFAPSSLRDYDWGNRRPVTSYCDDWYSYPNLPGNARTVTCAEWGNGDMRLHHLWWLSHLPRTSGMSDGVSNNWWEYIVDPNRVR